MLNLSKSMTHVYGKVLKHNKHKKEIEVSFFTGCLLTAGSAGLLKLKRNHEFSSSFQMPYLPSSGHPRMIYLLRSVASHGS